MDAKSRANFINSVAAGQKIPCPNCNAANEPDARFCVICGAKLTRENRPAAPAFGTAPAAPGPQQMPVENPAVKPAVNPAANPAANPAVRPAANPAANPDVRPAANPAVNPAVKPTAKPAVNPVRPPVEEIPEERAVFANGLPDWDILPPQVLVRRR